MLNRVGWGLIKILLALTLYMLNDSYANKSIANSVDPGQRAPTEITKFAFYIIMSFVRLTSFFGKPNKFLSLYRTTFSKKKSVIPFIIIISKRRF